MRRSACAASLLVLSCAAWAWPAQAGDRAVPPDPAWVPVPLEWLAAQRGGFQLPSGLQVSFGFERLVHVNGELVSALRVQVADVGRIRAAEAAQLEALGRAQLVQVGPGNTMQAQMAGLVIQNTLDNQSIQVRTTLDAGVGTLGMWQALNAAEALQQASQASLGGL